ncbi:hypothetical protein N7474_008984 [Penicillium riverlandense]|uniref:uncharacterized protein n=1 Tax=Penicillium riverlandense TaxID=1903569 RepID=UPI002547BD16|nr:uncharacterized protein N7474_008984 [Penicillium riverlandense]KAJ5812683.1 hypothetical protein N7474_008984 [Penicillium riverlandense]
MALETQIDTATVSNTVPFTSSVTTSSNVVHDAAPGLLHRSLVECPFKVTDASGSYLTLSDGRRILDGCGGAAVAILGHGNQEVIEATVAQMQKVSYVHTGTYTTDSAEDLAECILSAPHGIFQHGLEKAYFVGSGSEAVDTAMKLGRQFFWEQGQTQRVHFVSRRRSYHGNSIASMSISTNLSRKTPYDGAITLPHVSYVSPAYAYRGQRENESESSYVARLIGELDDEFQRIGPNRIVAFFAETVVGATAGCVLPPQGYFTAVQGLCNQYGILLVLDEIMCGMGRTGSYFAFEQENVQPDIVTIGKGLGGGYAPVAGVLISKKVIDVLRQGSSGFNHGHTYQAHPVSCATALAVQRILHRDRLVERCAAMGSQLETLLRSTFQGCKYVGDIRGRGLFQAIEFVADRKDKKPLRPSLLFATKVQQATFHRGVAVYPGPVTTEGSDGDHVLIAPPYNISAEDISIIVKALKEAYDEVEAQVDLGCDCVLSEPR